MSDQSLLSSRAIRGMYYEALATVQSMAWMPAITHYFSSDQASETYNWLGQTPKWSEWIGQRKVDSLRGDGVTIVNRHYQAGLEISKKDLRRDKTGQIQIRLQEMAEGSEEHWTDLVSQMIVDAPATACYDGQFFFDTDHSEGASGSQSNDIEADISGYPVVTHGSTTVPSKEEMQFAIFDGVKQIIGFKDDKGRNMNSAAKRFLVMTPLALYAPAKAAVQPLLNPALPQNMDPNMLADFRIDVVPNVLLDTLGSWTDKFAVFRTDQAIKPFIRQWETNPEYEEKAEGSDFAFDNKAHQYGVDAWRGAGLGRWQSTCLVTLI